MCGFCIDDAFLECLATHALSIKAFQDLMGSNFEPLSNIILPSLIHTEDYGIACFSQDHVTSQWLLWSILHLCDNGVEVAQWKAKASAVWCSYQNLDYRIHCRDSLASQFPLVFGIFEDGPLAMLETLQLGQKPSPQQKKLSFEVEQFLEYVLGERVTEDSEPLKLADGKMLEVSLGYSQTYYKYHQDVFACIPLELFFLAWWLFKVKPTSDIFVNILTTDIDCPDFSSPILPWRRYIAWQFFKSFGQRKFVKMTRTMNSRCAFYVAAIERKNTLLREEIIHELKERYKYDPTSDVGEILQALEQIKA